MPENGLDIVRALWTREEEFDYEGKYFQIKKGFHQPKPIQRPFPPVMNAGGSGIGRHFAAKHCDMFSCILREIRSKLLAMMLRKSRTCPQRVRS